MHSASWLQHQIQRILQRIPEAIASGSRLSRIQIDRPLRPKKVSLRGSNPERTLHPTRITYMDYVTHMDDYITLYGLCIYGLLGPFNEKTTETTVREAGETRGISPHVGNRVLGMQHTLRDFPFHGYFQSHEPLLPLMNIDDIMYIANSKSQA